MKSKIREGTGSSPGVFLRGALALGGLLSAACAKDPPAYEVQEPPGNAWRMPEEELRSRGPNIIWFGHSLLERRGNHQIHIPNTVRAIHDVARKTGRTNLPHGESRTHYEGPNDLRYWFGGAGKAEEKIRQGPKWDYVVGVGFMHLVGIGRRMDGTFTWLSDLTGSEKFKAYGVYTPSKYDAMAAVKSYRPEATWINYAGPRHSNHPEEQPFVDERFECIRSAGSQAGARVENVPIGRAFRRAEAEGHDKPDLGISLQLPDTLHLTKQGEYLAANAFYYFFYQVDPLGLPLPDSFAGELSADPKKESRLTEVLQRVARDTVKMHLEGNRIACAEPDESDRKGAKKLGPAD